MVVDPYGALEQHDCGVAAGDDDLLGHLGIWRFLQLGAILHESHVRAGFEQGVHHCSVELNDVVARVESARKVREVSVHDRDEVSQVRELDNKALLSGGTVAGLFLFVNLCCALCKYDFPVLLHKSVLSGKTNYLASRLLQTSATLDIYLVP